MLKSRLGATVAGLAAVLMAMTTTISTASAHELKSGGSPSDLDNDRSGYYVWIDGHDLHLQIDSTDDSTSYRGTLHTDGHFRNLSRDGDDNHAWISDDGHTLNFRATPNDNTDALKVRVDDSDKVDLDLKRNGDSAPTDRIWVGNDNDHPDDHSFTIHI